MREVKLKVVKSSSVTRAVGEESCLWGEYDEHGCRMRVGEQEGDLCVRGGGEMFLPLPMFPPCGQMSSSATPSALLHLLTHFSPQEADWGPWEQKLDMYSISPFSLYLWAAIASRKCILLYTTCLVLKWTNFRSSIRNSISPKYKPPFPVATLLIIKMVFWFHLSYS